MVSCLNIGEPLKRLPTSEALEAADENISLLEQFSINQTRNTLSCSHSGDNVTIHFKELPKCPVRLPYENLSNSDQSALTLWILSLYQLYLRQLRVSQSVVS